MKKSRRTFLEELIAAGLLTGALASSAETRTLFDDPLLEPLQNREPNNREFWKGFFDSIESTKRGGGAKLQDQNRKVQYLHLSEKNGLRYLNDIKSDELLDYDGDVMVSAAQLGQLRPGVEDQSNLADVRSSSLRVDFLQTKSFMNVLAPMAWAALAMFEHDRANKLPTLPQLGYQQFMDGKVLLTGGTGKFAINVYPVKPESTLHKWMKVLIPAMIASAPVLNLPALSIPVLRMVTELYLGPKDEETHGPPLLNSLPVRWCATQQGFADALEVDKFPLVEGDYVMVPQAHADELGKSISGLDWQRGFLVAKDASRSSSPDQRALDAIPGVTYVSMSMKITKVPQGGYGNSTRTNGGSDETGGDTSGGGKKPTSGGGGSGKPSGGGGPKASPTPTPRRTPSDE